MKEKSPTSHCNDGVKQTVERILGEYKGSSKEEFFAEVEDAEAVVQKIKNTPRNTK